MTISSIQQVQKGFLSIVIVIGSVMCSMINAQAFVTIWRTHNPGVTADDQIMIPIGPGGGYNYNVDWGDGTSDLGVTQSITHSYMNPGTYTVSISGTFPGIFFNNSGDK